MPHKMWQKPLSWRLWPIHLASGKHDPPPRHPPPHNETASATATSSVDPPSCPTAHAQEAGLQLLPGTYQVPHSPPFPTTACMCTHLEVPSSHTRKGVGPLPRLLEDPLRCGRPKVPI